jgi:hypothetical protein
MTIDRFKQAVTSILLSTNITPALLGTNCNLPRQNGIEIGYTILRAADFPTTYALIALYGPIVQPTCEHELNDISGFGQLYDTACIRYCILLGTKWVTGDQACEVGMKYPHFPRTRFIKKWKLTWAGEQQSPRCNAVHEIWQSADKSIIWSCEKSRMGQGGYAGLIFQSFKEAIAFVDWYLGSRSHYVKDIDMFINGLGGVNIEDYQKFREGQESLQRLRNSAVIYLETSKVSY